MKLTVLNTRTVEQEVIADLNSVTIDTGKMKVDISQNPDGSVRILTLSPKLGDTAVIKMSSGNCFDLSCVGIEDGKPTQAPDKTGYRHSHPLGGD